MVQANSTTRATPVAVNAHLDPETNVSPALAAIREILSCMADVQDDTAVLTAQSAHLGGDLDVWGGWQLMEGEVM